MKLGTQLVPPPQDETDVSNKRYVDTLGGRGNADFMQAARTGGDWTPVVANDVPFDTVDNSRELTLSSGVVSGLKAGRTYLVQAQLRISADDVATVQWYYWDHTAAASFGRIATARTLTETANTSDSSALSYIFTPDADTDVSVRIAVAPTGTNTVVDTGAGTWFSVVELFGSPLHGGLEHLETVELSAPAQDLTFSNLNGDSDEIYILEYDIIANSTGFIAYIWPNGSPPAASSAETQRLAVDNGAASHDQFVDQIAFASTGFTTANERETGRMEIKAKTGAHRTFMTDSISSISATRVLRNVWGSNWTDTATNITSIQVHGSVASAFNTGSRFSLYRLRAENGALPTLDKANLYTAAQTVAKYDLGTTSGTVNIDASLSNTFDLIVNGAATIAAPTNLEDGQSIVVRVRQDGTGSRAVTFNAVWDFGDDGAPDTSADAANTLMIVSGTSDGTNIFCSSKKGFTNT